MPDIVLRMSARSMAQQRDSQQSSSPRSGPESVPQTEALSESRSAARSEGVPCARSEQPWREALRQLGALMGAALLAANLVMIPVQPALVRALSTESQPLYPCVNPLLGLTTVMVHRYAKAQAPCRQNVLADG